MLHENITDVIIKSFYKVYNRLGYGFLEKVYENALAYELRKCGLQVKSQVSVKVFYDGQEIGEYFADLLIEDCVIVELKVSENLSKAHEAQLLNYLKSTEAEVGLLLNFGPEAQFKRKLFTNDQKLRR